MSSDDELPDIPYCPKPAKKLRSDEEEAFLDLQRRYHQLLDIPANQRSDEEKTETNQLRKKYSRVKTKFPHLVEERATATDAQRQAKSRQNMSEEARENYRAADRNRKSQPEAVAAARERMAQPEAVAAARERMAQPEARSATRERLAQPEAVAAARDRMQRRRLDPDQPRTYMDARRTTEIFSGHHLVPELKDTHDSIGWLGDQICPGCDALHWSRETSQTCCGWQCPCSKGKFNCDCNMMCRNPDKRVDGGCCGLKVSLPPFPTPPEELRNLWFGDSHEAKLFRANARSFNNALALSSIKVRELNIY